MLQVFKSMKVNWTLVFSTAAPRLVWMACAVHVSREHKEQSLESQVATQSSSTRPWCLQYRCGRTCMSASAGVRQAPHSSGAQRILHTAPSNRRLNLHTCFIVTARVGHIPPSIVHPTFPPPSLDDLLLFYFRVTTGYGNIWSVHSSHSLGAAGGGSSPPSLIYRRMQRVVESGHTLTGQRLCLYTQAFT